MTELGFCEEEEVGRQSHAVKTVLILWEDSRGT